jgi:hypothetical protein
MVGQLPLEQPIGVRIPGGQPMIETSADSTWTSEKGGSGLGSSDGCNKRAVGWYDFGALLFALHPRVGG